MPVPKVIVSGTKVTVKQTGSIVTLLSSIKSLLIQPQKGSDNPPHIQYNVSRAANKALRRQSNG